MDWKCGEHQFMCQLCHWIMSVVVISLSPSPAIWSVSVVVISLRAGPAIWIVSVVVISWVPACHLDCECGGHRLRPQP